MGAPMHTAPIRRYRLRRLWAWVWGLPLVALIDFDGEVSVRIGRTDALGSLWAKRFGFNIRNVFLLPNGEVAGCSYVRRWVMLADYRKQEPSS